MVNATIKSKLHKLKQAFHKSLLKFDKKFFLFRKELEEEKRKKGIKPELTTKQKEAKKERFKDLSLKFEFFLGNKAF